MAIDPEAKKEYDHQSYTYWKSQERCVRCHKQDAYTLAGRARCAECVEINRIEAAKYREKNREKAYERNRRWYAQVRKEGRCVHCGKEVEDPAHYATCELCRARNRAQSENRKREAGIYAKGAPGICIICNHRPVLEGKQQCAHCYQNSLHSLDKANAAIDREGHPWRRQIHAEVLERRTEG